MAYARTFRRRTYRKRAPARRPRKSSYRKRPRTRRPTRRTMRPTKRSILNLTSRKKRDVMLQTSNTSSTGAAKAPAVGATVINGSNGGWFYWSPTARDLDTVAGQPNTVSQEASRTSTTCFARGLSERLDIQTSSSVPWKWRRICFWTKSKEFLASASGATFNYNGWLETSAGVSRAFINSFLNNNNSLASCPIQYPLCWYRGSRLDGYYGRQGRYASRRLGVG